MSEEKKNETLFLDVKEGSNLWKNKTNDDYKLSMPPGLEISGKDLSGYSLYLGQKQVKAYTAKEDSKGFIVNKANQGLKFITLNPEKNSTLTKYNKETGENEKFVVSNSNLVPAVKAQRSKNYEEFKKSKQQPSKDQIKNSISPQKSTPSVGKDRQAR